MTYVYLKPIYPHVCRAVLLADSFLARALNVDDLDAVFECVCMYVYVCMYVCMYVCVCTPDAH